MRKGKNLKIHVGYPASFSSGMVPQSLVRSMSYRWLDSRLRQRRLHVRRA